MSHRKPPVPTAPTVPTGPTSPGLHADAVEVLSRWQAPDADQARLAARYLDHLHAHPDGMDRGCVPEHLTAGVVVLSADRSAVLLNLHAKANRWFAFGGHCEPGDASLAGVAEREGREESGIAALEIDPVPLHLSAHPVPFCHPGQDVVHLDVRFGATLPAGARESVSSESLELRWFDLDDLPALDADMYELIDLAAARSALADR